MTPKLSIAIIEPSEHVEVVDYLLDVLADVASLRIYLSTRCSAPTRTQLVVRRAPPGVAFHAWLKQRASEFAAQDLLLFVTLRVDPRAHLAITDLGVPMVALVHNAAFHFSASPPWPSHLLDMMRRLHWVSRGWWRARQLSEGCWAGLAFPTPAVEAFAKTVGYTGHTLCLPWATRNPGTPHDNPGIEILRIVVPGTVRTTDRAWQPLIDALPFINRRVEIVLLGAAGSVSGKAIVRSLSELNTDKVTLTSFRSAVPKESYERQLREADLLLLPLAREMRYATVTELGGVTKISGSEHDQLRAGRLAFVDAGYRGNPALASAQATYADGGELAGLINAFPRSASQLSAAVSPRRVHQEAWLAFLQTILEQR